ncbi:MAG TPA: carbohydrate kinase, partial [Sediminispirochaeta sp.]|nr:carbohydrate kinase [Sediminispirochaeta sp.]
FYLPLIRYFKVDAAEAEILTGLEDRKAAARRLNEYGAEEVMLTHHSEVIVCHQGDIYRAPYHNRSFKGRTGRGDTTFAAYLSRRRSHSIQSSLTFAAALCSIKMETPGPFRGSLEEVDERMRREYE